MSDENCCGACGYPIHATKDKACDWCRQTADRIEALTAKLAKLVSIAKQVTSFEDTTVELLECGCARCMAHLNLRATLAEIEGSNAP
jgi:hypothetical protein